LRAVRRDLAMIFQDPLSSLDPRMRVGQLLSEPMDIQFGNSAAERRRRDDRAVELLEKVGLRASDMERFPHAFSGGQRQRICIARSLMLGPSLMICDEPTSALDVSIQGQIIALLESLQEQFGLTYLFISHNLAVVQHISDEIAVMYLGKIVETASAKDLFVEPLHPYTEVLLSAVYRADPDQKMNRKLMLGDIPSPVNPPAGCRFHTRCRYAQAICGQSDPELRELRPGHRVACHFAETLELEGVAEQAPEPS
jgi:oligopeptide/dipeptide ABC transporter ATP-binding protein